MILGLDTETTGLNSATDRIIELCLGVYKDDGTFVQNVTMRFNPQMAIDPKTIAIHHITNEDVMAEPTFSERAKALHALVSKADLMVVHNSEFDVPFLRTEFMRCGLTAPDILVFDTMLESRWATPDGKYPKLGELCWALDVDYNTDEAHAADYDVDVMMKCFFEMNERGFMTENVRPFKEIQQLK